MPKKRKSNDNEIPETVIDAMGVNTNVDNSGEDPEIQTLVTKRTRKICQAPDCTTFARSAGYCIAHGGGKLCQAPDCTTNVVYGGLKGYCQKHGGGYRCQVPNCTSGAEAGGLLKGYCYAHGGGKRKSSDDRYMEGITTTTTISEDTETRDTSQNRKICQAPDCTKLAVYGGVKGYCQKHGGGYRCQVPDCTSGAESGGLLKGYCYAHGGGKRKLDDEKTVAKRKRKICQAPDCTTNAVYGGLKGYCQKHGGGYRCQSPGCTSGAEAGGLMKGFCYAHGGGKRKSK